jgi:2,3-dihydroxyphenylpropionate 1,2-dioxygenase
MPVSFVFASHTPLKTYHSPGAVVAEQVDTCWTQVREWVADFKPDLVIALGPDHYNGFFYRLMPSFCIGTTATSVGDWGTPPGDLPVDSEAALACIQATQVAGVDVALSHRMEVDHGITQLMQELFEWRSMPPLLPVFINCAAPPLPPLKRVTALGSALGTFASEHGGRVLFAASGGISHDPPIPSLATAPDAVRERLIEGGPISLEARTARQQRVLDDATNQVAGTSDRTPLNPDWDQRFLAQLRAFDFDAIEALDDDAITRDGGCGGHEIRTWLAAAAAARSVGVTTFDLRYYRAIPEWIAGYGVMTASN